MSNEKIILGLDIGVASVGWGLVKLAEEKYTDEKEDGTIEEKYKICGGEIIGAGVRGFQLPQDRQKKSLAKQRGQARRSRWTIHRKARRLKRLISLAKEYNLIGDDFDRDEVLKPKKGVNKKEKWDIWYIRQQALERKLEDIELFRILYHIAKHRGWYFHTKAEEAQKEDPKSEEGKAKAGLARIEKLLESKWKTVGQMFWETLKQTDKKRKRNAKDKYENSIRRLLLKKEIEEVFKEQRKLKNDKAKPEFEQRYIEDILMYEEGPDDKKLQKTMSRCEFEGELCAPKESYTAERFTLFNRLNTLELYDTQERNGQLSLDEPQRRKIEALAYNNAKVTFSQIRKELGLEDELHIQFNLCSYAEKNPEYKARLECEIKEGRLQFDEKHKVTIVDINTGEENVLDEEIKKIFNSKKLWAKAKKVHVYYSDIRRQLNLSESFRFTDVKGYTQSVAEFEREARLKAEKKGKKTNNFHGEAAYIKQFEEDTFVELKGYHKIRKVMEGSGNGLWDQIRCEPAQLDVIAEALTYCKSDETRSDYLRRNGITDEKVIEAVLTINMKQLASYSKEALRNLLTHMEKGNLFDEAKKECGYDHVAYDKQAILKPYSDFFEKNPVVARVISQSRKVINAIVRKYGNDYPIDSIHIEVATELANSEKRKQEISQGQERYKEDKKRARERCLEFNLDPEEGQNLLMFRLAEQQRNICPYSRKAIVYRATGADNEVYIRDCEIDHIIPMSRSFNDSLNNKVLCTQKSNQDKRDRIPFEWFEERSGKDSRRWYEFERYIKQLYSMPYPKRKNLLRKSWTEEDKEKFISRDLNDTRYAARHIADYLRRYFDFSRSRRNDIKEVSRIQLRSGGVTAFLRHMWGLNKVREENDLHHAMDALVVACSTYGHVYLVSKLSREIERKGQNWYKNFGRDKFRPWENVREDINNAVGEVFVSRMPRHTVTGGAHKDTIASLTTRPRTKRVLEVNNGYAEMGDIVRADVFVDKDGKNYVVPIYAVDFARNKPLPDRYVPDKSLPYEQWPSVNDNGLEFKFSLFKDDLIGVNDKMYYVSFFEATTTSVNVKNIDGSIFPDKKDAKVPDTRKMTYRPQKKTSKFVLKKYSVNMLGNYREIKQERRRLGNRNFEAKRRFYHEDCS